MYLNSSDRTYTVIHRSDYTMNNTATDIKLYRLKELSSILNVSTRTLKTYLSTGRLKGVKIGGAWTVTDSNLQAFINGDQQQ